MTEIEDYRVAEELGRDDAYVMLRATRVADGRRVLVKRPADGGTTPARVAALRREHELIVDLRRAGVPGLPAPAPGNAPGGALVLDDPGGSTLRAALARRRFGPREATACALWLARTLRALHAAGVTLRTLCPACVLHDDGDAGRGPVVLDLLHASRLPQERAVERPPEALRARLPYLAPEQTGRTNRVVDHRSDLYALGVLLYELMVGAPPFVSDDPLELVHWQLARVPAAPAELDPALPRPLSAIVMKLLAKNADDRYQGAAGLATDLESCLSDLEAGRDVAPIALGTRDRGERFTIPQALYGREAETARLLAAFERACAARRPALLLVSGWSGIGKTSLVREIHGPVARARGRYVAGKFGQLERHVPHGALLQALRALLQQVLAGTDAEIAAVRARLAAAPGANTAVLEPVLPALRLLVPPQPPPPPLGPAEARNRFHFALQEFVRAFATPERPLVIFLDDLQWADAATLQFLPLLLAPEGIPASLFVVGAYRENEVPDDHPLRRTLREIRDAGAPAEELTLAPLRPEDTAALCRDALLCGAAAAAGPARLVQRRTAGNPFFATQFLRLLHADGLVTFDDARSCWVLDEARAAGTAAPDSAVDLLTAKLHRLGGPVRRAVTLAACTGNRFALRDLATVCEQSLRGTAADLWPAIEHGLVVPESPHYELLAAADEDLLRETAPAFRFLHDRVQQAAYELIPPEERPAVHLRVGRLLRAGAAPGTGEAVPAEALFEIVQHLNRGAARIETPGERAAVAALDLEAGRRAKSAAAYGDALAYLEAGLALLPERPWESAYGLTRDLHLEAAECAYLCGRFEEADARLDVLLARARTPEERGEAGRVRIVQNENRARYAEAVAAGRRALAEFGVVLPESDDEKRAALSRELARIDAARAGRPIESLVDLQPLSDAPTRSVMRLLTAMWAPAYIAPDGPLTALISALLVRLSLTHGNCGESAYGYVTHAITVGTGLGDYRAGHEWGRLALAVNERFEDLGRRAKVQHMFSCFVNLWREPLESCLPHAREAHRVGVQTGDFVYATYAIFHESWYGLLCGMPLGRFAAEYGPNVAFLARIRNDSFAAAQQVILHWARAFEGRTAAPGALSSEAFDERAYEAAYGGNAFFATFLWVVRLILATAFGAGEDALVALARAEQVVPSLGGTVWGVLVAFHGGLALAAQPAGGPARRAALDRHLRTLARHAEHAPHNFRAWHLALAAEAARLDGEVAEAVALYERAADAARAAGRVQDEALAQELFARFWLARGNTLLARPLLEAARDGYARWGAAAKVRQLTARHADLLGPAARAASGADDARDAAGDANGNANGDAKGDPPREPASDPPREPASDPPREPASSTLDLETVRRAAHALAAEIEMPRLLRKLIRLAIENAGAERGVLLQERGSQLLLVAAGAVDPGERLAEQVAEPPVPFEDGADHGADHGADLPAGIVQFVRRTGESLLLADAATDPLWSTDAYVAARRPRSILCVPIRHQGQGRGVLYLENNLAADAFTRERLEMMTLLAGEAGIALENARLFEELAALKNRLQQENVYLQEEIRTEHNFDEIVGNSPALLAALRQLERVAATDTTVLILGATGTGKELFARAIHDRSARKERPLVKVNCGAIAAGLVESELFGHVKGAFTGALQNRVGRFELAHRGTLFLDEVGELALETQAKLLRVLQEQEFEAVGSSRTVRVDVRVIAATNRDLGQAVREGTFRADLLYRLNVFPLEVPALRDRPQDIPLLASFFLARAAKRLGKPLDGFRREGMRRLCGYGWPGNVRELQNLVERLAILATGPVVDVDARLLAGLPGAPPPAGAPSAAAYAAASAAGQGTPTLEQLERAYILDTLRDTGGVVEGPAGAARRLGLNPNTLRSRMKKLGIATRRGGGGGLATPSHDIS